MKYYIICDDNLYGEYKEYKEAKEKATQLTNEYGKYHKYSIKLEFNSGKKPNFEDFKKWCINNAKKILYINYENILNCKGFSEKFFYEFATAYINSHLGIKNAYGNIKNSKFYNKYGVQYCEFLQCFYCCYDE